MPSEGLIKKDIMAKVFIGLGSNLGTRRENCESAISRIREAGVSVLARSALTETKPWGVTEQPDFLNMVIEIETHLKPHDLLALLKNVERTLGRTDTYRWGPRVIDLDILLYDDVVMKTADLEIPHPRISEREFVLHSLAEIAPGIIHPVLKKSMKTLLQEVVRSQ